MGGKMINKVAADRIRDDINLTCKSETRPDNMPGISFPRWQVELLKIRNGKPGRWQLEWTGTFRHIYTPIPILSEEQIRKTG